MIQRLPLFNRWYPNLQRLELVLNTFNPKFADVHFPQLQELRLFLTSRYEERKNALEYTKCLLHKNPHLICLEIDVVLHPATVSRDLIPIDKFLGSITGQPTISKLKTTYGFGFSTINSANLLELALIFPSLVEIDLKPCQASADDAIRFVGQQKELKYFQFTCEGSKSKLGLFQTQLSDEWRSTIAVVERKSATVTLKR